VGLIIVITRIILTPGYLREKSSPFLRYMDLSYIFLRYLRRFILMISNCSNT